MAFNFKDLITKLENCGVDTQPVRTLQMEIANGNVVDSSFSQLLVQLHTYAVECESNPSKLMSVEILLNQITKRLNGIKIEQENSQNSSLDFIKLMEKLESLESKLASGSPNFSSRQSSKKTTVEDIGLDTVYVSPINPDEELKANVTIKEKKGNSIADKLKRLKELKGK